MCDARREEREVCQVSQQVDNLCVDAAQGDSGFFLNFHALISLAAGIYSNPLSSICTPLFSTLQLLYSTLPLNNSVFMILTSTLLSTIHHHQDWLA